MENIATTNSWKQKHNTFFLRFSTTKQLPGIFLSPNRRLSSERGLLVQVISCDILLNFHSTWVMFVIICSECGEWCLCGVWLCWVNRRDGRKESRFDYAFDYLFILFSDIFCCCWLSCWLLVASCVQSFLFQEDQTKVIRRQEEEQEQEGKHLNHFNEQERGKWFL